MLGNDIVEVSPDFIQEVGVEMTELDDLLARSDFISVNCDLNPTSLRLINATTFEEMKPRLVREVGRNVAVGVMEQLVQGAKVERFTLDGKPMPAAPKPQ